MKNIEIEDFKLEKLEDARFVRPVRINYIQSGSQKTWEAVQSFDSIAVLIYHKEKDSFVLVKQFRPPVYMNHNEYKYTYELCAGIIDKEKTLEEIAAEEIDEECGYEVDVKDIKKITSFFTNVGVSGGKQYLFFAIVDESMKIHDGGGINDEMIELEYLPLSKAKEFIYDETKAKTPGLSLAFYWFFENYNTL